MKLASTAPAALLLLAVAACGGPAVSGAGPGSPTPDGGTAILPPPGPVGGGGGGVGGGGGTVDGPAWFINGATAVINAPPSPNVDFDRVQNTTPGGINVGTSRTIAVLVYNISKNTPLTISSIAIEGIDAADFSVSPESVKAALNLPIPANRSLFTGLNVTFTPLTDGVRHGTLHLVSNAGTAMVLLTGTALPLRPVIVTNGGAGVYLIPSSAPVNLVVRNVGGEALVLHSISIGGANPSSFRTVSTRLLSNCFGGVTMGPLSECNLGVGLAPGALPPASATLVIASNDPLHPTLEIPLTLSP